MVQKLESLSQVLSGNDFVVTGSVRTGSRLAMWLPVSVPSERLPLAETDRFNPQGMNPCGLRAGRSVGVSGSPLSRRLSGHAGATSRTRGAYPSAALKPPTVAQRGVRVETVNWCRGRMCRTATTTGRHGPRTRPVT
jgi:hypothetical protein